uniref:Secreted protein n=1 Tax=Aegilops tauschii subsp. strangulata TaxID=200361 RepID=A0A453I3E4_AEGTS
MPMLVLWLSPLPVFSLSFPSLWASLPSLRCGHVFASAISPLVMRYTCLWFARSMLFSRVTPLLMIPTHRVLLSSADLTLFTAGCRTCQWFQAVWSDLEFHRVYEFLSQLHKEFEPWRAELFARGCISSDTGGGDSPLWSRFT